MLMIAKGCRIINNVFFIMYGKRDVPDRYARLRMPFLLPVMRVAVFILM